MDSGAPTHAHTRAASHANPRALNERPPAPARAADQVQAQSGCKLARKAAPASPAGHLACPARHAGAQRANSAAAPKRAGGQILAGSGPRRAGDCLLAEVARLIRAAKGGGAARPSCVCVVMSTLGSSAPCRVGRLEPARRKLGRPHFAGARKRGSATGGAIRLSRRSGSRQAAGCHQRWRCQARQIISLLA